MQSINRFLSVIYFIEYNLLYYSVYIWFIFQVCFGQHFADHWCQEGEQTSGPLLDCLYCGISYLVMSQPSNNLLKEIYPCCTWNRHEFLIFSILWNIVLRKEQKNHVVKLIFVGYREPSNSATLKSVLTLWKISFFNLTMYLVTFSGSIIRLINIDHSTIYFCVFIITLISTVYLSLHVFVVFLNILKHNNELKCYTVLLLKLITPYFHTYI